MPKTADTKIQNALFVGSTAELQKMLKKMKILKAQSLTPNKEIFKISDLAITKHGFILEDILNGADMINPIQVHKCTNKGKVGAFRQTLQTRIIKSN